MRYTHLLSGQRQDPLAFCLRGLLRMAEVPYRVVVSRRNHRFDRGLEPAIRCGVPVISIGNLTTGGTGKTPLVCFIARHLRKRNVRVSIISRGYGAKAGEDNDEAMELARRLSDVPHVQDADRVEAARIAVEELESELVLMDDGFQHRRLHRNLDLVVIDATNPFGYEHLLPRGLLREPIDSLARADAVILSRADFMNVAQREEIHARVVRFAPSAIWAEAIHASQSILTWPDTERPISSIAGKKVVLLSAIGNPQAFASTVQRCGAEIVDTLTLPDHDPYSPQTVREIAARLQRCEDRSSEVICTHKDLVKLQTDRLGGLAVRALLIELQVTVGEQELLNRIDATLTTHRPD